MIPMDYTVSYPKEVYYKLIQPIGGFSVTKHIRTLAAPRLQATVQHVGCTDCAVSCQSACKTSCTVGNIVCSVSSLTNPAAQQLTLQEVARR